MKSGRRRNDQRSATYGSLLGHARFGAGLYSDVVSLRLSSLVALALGPFLHPSLLTLAGLSVGVATGVLAILAVDVRPTWLFGVIVVLGWQLAYVLDCADGQVARATGKTSDAGAAVDIFCDFAVQTFVVAAVSTAAVREHPISPAIIALFAATWMVNLVSGILFRSLHGERNRLLRTTTPLAAMLRLSRDYGFVVLLLGLSYAFWRPTLLWLMIAILVVNGGFLVASIANEARLSFAATRHSPSPENASPSSSSQSRGGGIQPAPERMRSS